MKISQLVATKIKTPYHESIASRLPRGIKTQQQLLNLGYKIAVEDLGLAKAKTLNENFAAKLVNSYHNRMLNEGVGSFLGKLGGHVVGAAGAAGRGLSNAWKDAKQGYADAKASWDPKDPAAAATPSAPAGATPSAPEATPPAASVSDRPYVAPASGGAAAPEAPAAASPGGETPSPPVAGTPPKTSGGGVGDIMKAIDGLDPASKKQLAGELEKSINTPPPAAEKPAAEPQGQALDLDQLKKDREAKLAAGQADQQQAQQQMDTTAQANAATNQQNDAIKAAADAARAKPPFQQTAADKLAIKKADDVGLHEEDELEEGFHSNFLGMIL